MIELSKVNRVYIISSILASALLLIVSVHPAQGRDGYQDKDGYYVATTGDDDNPGTQSSPWKTIQFAVDQVEPGDTIYVRAGMYYDSVALNQAGVEGSPITLAAYGDESVNIDGGEAPALTARWDGTQYWIIEGFTLDSSAEYTVKLSMWETFWSDHMIIRNNYIRGAVIVSGSYNIFEGNEVDGSQHKGNENGVSEETQVSHHNIYRSNHVHHFKHRGIWSMRQTHDSVFENNYVHHIGDGDYYEQGIDLDGFGSVVWRHIVRNNNIHDSGYVGIQLENTFDSTVESNIIHDSSRGIAVINYGGEVGDGWGTDKRCEVGGESGQYGDTNGDNDCRGDLTGNNIRQNLIYNIPDHAAIVIWHAGGIKILANTIHCGEIGSAGGGAAGIYLDCEDCPDLEMQSNIIAECGWGAINIKGSSSLTRDSNNLIYQPDFRVDYWIDGSRYSLSQYQEMTGKGQGSVVAEAGFIDPSVYDFRLLPDSPAIDAGINIGLATDLDGRSRPQGSGYDLGVYEYGILQQLEITLTVYLPIISTGHGQ